MIMKWDFNVEGWEGCKCVYNNKCMWCMCVLESYSKGDGVDKDNLLY